MDNRFSYSPLLDRRKEEWNFDNIQKHVNILFSNIESVPGWKFVNSEWSVNIKGTQKEELKKSILRFLKVNVLLDDVEDEYKILFPELWRDQFFFIGGYLKVPIFQLLDHPIIYRNNNPDYIKIKTNTASFNVIRKDGETLLNVFNKTIPIEKAISLVHTPDEFETFFEMCPRTSFIQEMYDKCYKEWDTTPDYEDRVKMVGSYFMNYPQEIYKKGDLFKFSFEAAYNVDHFTRPLLNTNSLLFESLYAIAQGPTSDTDIGTKRIRLLEYILSPLTRKVYDMLVSLHKNPKEKFQIAQNVILEMCNKSDTVHFNFPLNPVGEIASLMQCSLTGPGGFKKDNVPLNLRNLDDSHYGYLCGADTPDREGCGVILNMVPTVNLDDTGNFIKKDLDITCSFPISLAPFVQNDDVTRLQMESNQAKQTIMIKQGEHPYVKTGTEGCFLDKTSFLHKAEMDGEVIYKDKRFIAVKYSNNKHDVFEIGYRSMYLDTVDYIVTDLNEEDTFKIGDTICYSKFIKDGEVALGHNFLTAIMIAEGFNYEDGIVVSQSFTEKMTSLHFVDLTYDIEPGQVLLSLDPDTYKPLPVVGETFKTGQAYAKLKTIDWEECFDNINEEPKELTVPSDCTIVSIEIYPNNWNKRVNEFNSEIQQFIDGQLSRYDILINRLSANMSEKEIKNFSDYYGLNRLNCSQEMIGEFSAAKEIISGIRLKITAVYEEKIGIGDKIANRHGNKGVISKVIPDDQMPIILEDGRRAEIVINPLGIISRMNTGQLYELHMTEMLHQFKKKMMRTKNDEAALKKLMTILDNTEDKWVTNETISEYIKNKNEHGKDYAVDHIYLIMPSNRSISPEQFFKCMKAVGSKELFKVSYPYDDIGDIENEIACGYMYWLKLVHRAKDKLSSRSIGPYSRRTSQPLGGKKRGGGHRLGEMEQWALASHGSKEFLKDLLTTHSDSPGLKNKVLAEMLQNPDLFNEEENNDLRPQSLRVLDAYFTQLGLSIDFSEDSE